jgi:hypothetical protein
MARRPVEPIKGAVESLLAGLKSRVLAEEPEQALKSVLTGKELVHVRIRSLSKGVLRLSIDSSAWLYYFNLRRKRLTEALSARIPEIKELSFVIGEMRPRRTGLPR